MTCQPSLPCDWAWFTGKSIEESCDGVPRHFTLEQVMISKLHGIAPASLLFLLFQHVATGELLHLASGYGGRMTLILQLRIGGSSFLVVSGGGGLVWSSPV
jgi:hypothetical protein